MSRPEIKRDMYFTMPPPGFHGQSNLGVHYESLNRGVSGVGLLKLESGSIPNAAPQRRPSSDSGYSFYQGSNLLPQPRAANIFNVPPPPPANCYLPNIMAAPSGYGYNNVMYPVTAPVAAPPAEMSSTGAGRYLSSSPRNNQPPQFQGDYSSRYSKRGGFNNFNRKRTVLQEHDADGSKRGSTKKKKKPLSQNMPSKKDWSLEDAKRALDVERDCNKRHKSPSLIIKFPDLEINRDIVSQFHSKIQSVHFQQPSTPRFCFVTLKDSACMEEVIKDLSKIKFGYGYLTAERKNIKEDDLVKGPEDIDPLTLYVGNLAQEVTVDDVIRTYPKQRRIDIGFAKKMKYTRYAFVCFRTVDDAIDAFQKTHATEMYNKSLIVRFRRLHGTVGLPGDQKPQYPPKQSPIEQNNPTGPASVNNIDKSDPLTYHIPVNQTPPTKSSNKCWHIEYDPINTSEGFTDAAQLMHPEDLNKLFENEIHSPSPIKTSVKSEFPVGFDPSVEPPVAEVSHVPMISDPPVTIKLEPDDMDEKEFEKFLLGDDSVPGSTSDNVGVNDRDDLDDALLSDSSF